MAPTIASTANDEAMTPISVAFAPSDSAMYEMSGRVPKTDVATRVVKTSRSGSHSASSRSASWRRCEGAVSPDGGAVTRSGTAEPTA
jgi:hypothetical protein